MVRPPREPPVPVVGAPLAGPFGFAPPGVGRPSDTAARGVLPLRLGGQGQSGPDGVRLGVLVGDVHDRVVLAAVEIAARSLRAPPARAGRPPPPLAEVPQVDRPGRAHEDHRPGHEVLRRGPGEVGGVERALGDRPVAGGVDEGGVGGVGDGRARHPDRADLDVARRRLLGVVVVGSHAEGAPRHPDHVVRGRGAGRDRGGRLRHVLWTPVCSSASTSSRLNVAGFCRGGNSTKLWIIWKTNACIGTATQAWSRIQS